jgi:hypothetical protein
MEGRRKKEGKERKEKDGKQKEWQRRKEVILA